MSAGRTRVTAKALEGVLVAAAAEVLAVPAGTVRGDLADRDGDLDLAIAAPLPVVSIARVLAEPLALERMGGGAIMRAESAAGAIGARFTAVTGHRVARVRIRITDARIEQDRRVR